MSPRRTRPSRAGAARSASDRPETDAAASGFETVEVDAGGAEWKVRHIRGSSSTKPYRCPGCDQEIRPATPHVVAWPFEPSERLDERRHWHTPCWNARDRRGVRDTRRGR